MTSSAIANRGLKGRHKFWFAYSMFPARVGNGVEWPYRATDAEHPVLEQHRDGLRPFSHDLVNRRVWINLQAVPRALFSWHRDSVARVCPKSFRLGAGISRSCPV